MDEYISGLILGLVEGITEFLPISSTGHMILAGEYLGFTGPRADTFTVFIQLGAILAVVYLYFSRFKSLLSFDKGEGDNGKNGIAGPRGIIALGVACAPVFVLGILFRDIIKNYLFNPTSVAIALIVGGILMIGVESRRPRTTVETLEQLTLPHALAVGLAQCLSLWPGMSRSASTMLGGLLSGVHRTVAAEFSFLVAVPVMCAAVLFDLLKSISYLTVADIPLFGLGFVVSFIVAIIAIKGFIGLLSKFTLRPFGVYRIILGIAVLALL